MVKKRAHLSEENDPLTSTEQVLAGLEQLSQSASHLNNKGTSQKVDKSSLRKATFQLSEEILEQLDQLHLRLQLELGKAKAPYKEVIVEDAIARLLAQVSENRSELVKELLIRQSQRK